MTGTARTSTSAESVLFESPGGLLKGRHLDTTGRFELTASRIVYYRQSPLWLMFGLIGALLGRRTTGKRVLELEFARIASIARGKYGLSKKILNFKMTDGSEHRLSIEKFDQFVEKLTATSGHTVAPLAA